MENAFVAAYAARRAIGRVLDVPVGTGRFLPSYATATQVVGVDVSHSMLQEGAARIGSLALPPVALVRADALRLPFPDASFDTVICFRLVHLLPPELLSSFFRELGRVSRGPALVQFYFSRPAGAVRSVLRRVLRKLRPAAPAAPWSHIQSYPHTRAFIEVAIGQAGLRVGASDLLGEYQGASVRVLHLVR